MFINEYCQGRFVYPACGIKEAGVKKIQIMVIFLNLIYFVDQKFSFKMIQKFQ